MYIDKSALIVTQFQKHVLGTQKKRLNETILLSTKLNDKTGDQNIFTILHSKLCSCIGHMLPFQRLKDRLDFIHLKQCKRKESTVSKFFKQSGKLFQMTGHE